jgi:putative ABC transport system permease protein
MIKNYFRIAWRNLMKNKVFSFINIFGLTIGLITFLLIALYVFDELTFDGFHKNSSQIYRVIEKRTTPEGTVTKTAGAAYHVSERGKTDFPEIKDGARLYTFSRTNVSTLENNNVFYENWTVGNSGILTLFDFKIIQGDRNTALSAPHSVILTEEMAERLFNTTNVLGKAVKLGSDSMPYKITAVLKNFPTNSHLSFNLVFSEPASDAGFKNFIATNWNPNFRTYLLLNKGANLHQVETRIGQFVAANKVNKDNIKSEFILQPIKDIHFYSNDIEGDSGNVGNISYIYVFSIVGLFVLLIACINYMNLTTARFTKRAKEIGIRKVTGATRRILVLQFLAEAFLVTLVALLVALIAVEVLLPAFNAFTEKKLSLNFQTDSRIWAGLAITLIAVVLFSGIYPALFQSGLKPLALLKSKVVPGKRSISVRRSLVVSQFALSIIMIVATMVVYMQMKYVQKKDMGFNKEQLLVIDINSGKVRNGAETIKSEFAKLPQVKDVSVTSRVPGEWKDIPKIKVKNRNTLNEGNDMYFLGVDDQFLKTYQVDLLKGRNFTAGGIADSSSIILNETAAKQLGITDPSDQIVDILFNRPLTGKVMGIVKDFNFKSLREPVSPMILGFQKNPIQNIDYFTARVETANVEQMLGQMNAIIHSIDQNHLMEYHFLDNQWDRFYREDRIRETIFFIISLLTIFIACLGLFGLATYAAEQRIKEIGIRKVLGASVTNIVSMLSKDFLKLIIISSLLAFPVAWWAMNDWLKDFAYHISISWWVFFAAGSMAILIALLTISFRAINAARGNPVKSLRTE